MRMRGIAIGMLLASMAVSAAEAEHRELPVGVYMSWELAHAYAAENQLPLSDFLDRSLEICRERGVNTLWVTNIDASDLGMLQELCDRYDIGLLANACEGKVASYYRDDAAELRFRAGLMAKAATPALTHWVISDEPEAKDTANLTAFAGILGQSDPERQLALVVTHHAFEDVIGAVPLDMAAIDPYPFFGPGNPNGPHTREASEAHFRSFGERFVRRCREFGVEPWLMPQAFAELWGPYEYRPDGTLVGLPGAYLHWLTPTVAEMRWQLFESLRQGAQGVIFFQLYPTMLPANGGQPVPDVAWKDILAKEETPVGCGALLTLYGKTTPQFDELGRFFPVLRQLSGWLVGARPVADSGWLAAAPKLLSSATFTRKDSGEKFMILVNDDLENPVQVVLGPGTFTDLITRNECREVLELAPGGGAIVTRNE